MAYDFSNFKNNICETKEWLSKELATVRTGRANPSILDSVLVESYGAKMPLKQVAGVNVEDARTLRIAPYSPDQIKSVESAIRDANLGLSLATDERGVRAIFPELTGERRESLIKIAKDKAEKARVSIRGERDEIWNDIQAKQRNGEISEDDKFQLKDEMQKLVDETIKSIDDSLKRKEEEIKN